MANMTQYGINIAKSNEPAMPSRFILLSERLKFSLVPTLRGTVFFLIGKKEYSSYTLKFTASGFEFVHLNPRFYARSLVVTGQRR